MLEYAAQAIAYSLIAAVTVELLLFLWQVENPSLSIAFRLPVLTVPPVLPLLFALLGSDQLRQEAALLSLNNWLGPGPGLEHPVWLIVLVAMGATATLEGAALIRWLLPGRVHSPREFSQADGRLLAATVRLVERGISMPPVQVVDRPYPTAYTTGLLQPTVIVSPALVNLLDDEEIEGVLAHERAHARRQDNWLGWLAFALRILSFYNPVVQFAFHRIGHDTEKVCDAEAGEITGKPLALASALIKVYMATRSAHSGPRWATPLGKRAATLENKARRTLVQDRAERLVHPETVGVTSYPGLRLALCLAAVMGLTYLTV